MREYLLVLLVAAGVTYVGASLARRLAFRYNAVALVRDRDVHTTPIPYFGGVAMLAGTTAALILATNLPWLGRFELVQRDAWAVFWASVLILKTLAMAMLTGMQRFRTKVSGIDSEFI